MNMRRRLDAMWTNARHRDGGQQKRSMGWYVGEKEEYATKFIFYSPLRETLARS
jgi:hypothetical protein